MRGSCGGTITTRMRGARCEGAKVRGCGSFVAATVTLDAETGHRWPPRQTIRCEPALKRHATRVYLLDAPLIGALHAFDGS